MKNKKLLFLTILPFLFLVSTLTSSAKQNLEVWANLCGGSFQNGQRIELFANDSEAKIFWTIFPNGSPAKGNIYESPIEIKRSLNLYFFAYTNEENATKYQKCRFNIESAEETNYLKILKINPKDNLITIKNWSKFETDLSNWQLESLQQKITLPEITLKPEEEIEIELKTRRVLGEIKLISPKGILKDWTQFPRMQDDEFWERADNKDAFSVFVKTKIAER